MVIEADIGGREGRTAFRKYHMVRQHALLVQVGGGAGEGTAGDRCHALGHGGADFLYCCVFRFPVVVAGQVLGHAVAVIFRICLKTQIEVYILFGTDVGENDPKGIGPALPQQLGPLIGHVAKGSGSVHDLPYFLAAHISLPVENVGYGALGHSGRSRNVFDGSHLPALLSNDALYKDIFDLILPYGG